MENTPETIFDYITQQEALYQQEIPVNDHWNWSMKTHVEEANIYKYSQLWNDKKKNTIDELPVKNIVKPILNLRYRAQDVEAKQVELYVDDPDIYHLSFLVKKYHDDKFLVENDLDSFFDALNEDTIDKGSGLVMNNGQALPQIMRFEDIAFCNQHNLMSSPIGFRYEYSFSELQEMESRHWGDKNYGADTTIEELISLAKTQDRAFKKSHVEIYLVSGSLPEKYLDGDSEKYVYQMQILAYYFSKDGKKGRTLFRVKTDNPFKFYNPDKIHNRALGWGGVEELLEPQIWTNFDENTKKDFLMAASKIIHLTDDAEIAARHPSGFKGMDNSEIITVKDGKRGLWQADTYPRNIVLFEKAAAEWQEHAQRLGSATDPLLGETPNAGTPFRLQERVVIEGKGIHEYRRGKYAKFIEELYRDWFLNWMVKEMSKGTKFLSELSLDELQSIAEKISIKERNKFIKERILSEKEISQEEADIYQQKAKDDFINNGTKKFIEILKDEIKNIPLKIKINVAGKQKDLALMTDKLVNIFRQIFANPMGFLQVMQIPMAAKAFNEILEYSGLSPMIYNVKQMSLPQTQQPLQQTPSPMSSQMSPEQMMMAKTQ